MRISVKEKAIKRTSFKKSRLQSTLDFNSIFEAAPGLNLILLPDENFTIVAVSDSYNRATMTKREEILGCGLFDVFPANPNDLRADGVPNLRNSLNTVIKTKKPHKMPFQKYDIQKPASEEWEVRYWDPCNFPVLDKKGETKYIIHNAVDVTEEVKAKERERIQAERTKALEVSKKESIQKLKESEERFRHLTESVKDCAIFILDTNGIVISWNKGAERINGYRPEEIVGKNISVLYRDEDLKNRVPAYNLKMALENGSYEVEGWRVRKDRSVFWVNAIYTPFYNDTGKHIGFSKITRDLTQRKKYEEEIKKTNIFLDSVLENIPNMVFVKDANELNF